MDLVKIPSYLTYDNVSGVRATPVLPLAKEEFQRIRENLVATFIRDFQPHAFVIDFHPEGKSGELIPTVTGSPNVKKVLGLRGILGSPEETNREFFNARLVAFMQEYFSAIHVYVDERVLRLEEYYAIPASLSSMLKYTGYVTRPTTATKAEARAMLRLDPGAHIIFLSFGGGLGTDPIRPFILHASTTINNPFHVAFFPHGPFPTTPPNHRLPPTVSD